MNFGPKTRATIFLLLALAVSGVAASHFLEQWAEEDLFPSSALTEIRKLSEFHPPLEGTAGDTEAYYFDSGIPGGTLLVCGGTHPNESAAYMAAVAILENLQVTEGRVIVIPRANKTGFTHNDSQEAMPQFYTLQTPHGERLFRHGSRLTNPVRQWPDPSIYINPRGPYWEEIVQQCPSCAAGNPGPGGQMISGVDSRNLNRTFPGDPDGTLTEQIAFGIVELIRSEQVDLAVDFHEASPEYPTINVMVAHERASSVTSWAELLLSDDGISISTETSSPRLRGLSHREWGDASLETLAVLFESTNVVQGRLKGRTTEAQIVDGYDPTYYRAMLIQEELNERLQQQAEEVKEKGGEAEERFRKILYVDYPKKGVPIEERVARHVTATRRLVEAYNDEHPGEAIGLARLPEYGEFLENGLGPYLHGPRGELPQAVAAEQEEGEVSPPGE